ncbi:MAG TPA: TetR/AcrR family transcriptional regulator [Moraxellaceae bacterium]|nr:TetR/AcrR family transcriptional regulator [Moraxellaceae bacterium]
MARQAESAGAIEAGEEQTRGHKKKARTRQQLLDAALRIYARKGASSLALNELAEEAGVSNGTIYNYFRTREEVLDAVGLELAVQLSHQVTAVSIGVTQGAERMSIGIRTFLLKAMDDPEWASALTSVMRYAEGMRTALAAHVRHDLQVGQLQGDFHYVDEDIALTMVVSATLGAMASIVEGMRVEHLDSIMAEMILLALGVTAKKAKQVANLPMPAVVAPEADSAQPPATRTRRTGTRS